MDVGKLSIFLREPGQSFLRDQCDLLFLALLGERTRLVRDRPGRPSRHPIQHIRRNGTEASMTINLDYCGIAENDPARGFFNLQPDFDGSAGVGRGRLEERPSTCTTGVAYWATDQGDWNSAQEGPGGQ